MRAAPPTEPAQPRARRSLLRHPAGPFRTRSQEPSRISTCGVCLKGFRCPSWRHRLRAAISSRRAAVIGGELPISMSPLWKAHGLGQALNSRYSRGIERWAIRRAEMWPALNPRRFAAPLEVEWLDDDRFNGSMTGTLYVRRKRPHYRRPRPADHRVAR